MSAVVSVWTLLSEVTGIQQSFLDRNNNILGELFQHFSVNEGVASDCAAWRRISLSPREFREDVSSDELLEAPFRKMSLQEDSPTFLPDPECGKPA